MPIRTKYLQQLDELTENLKRLAEKASADARATGLAVAGDTGAAEGVLLGGKAERQLRSAIESGCLDAMLMQQPLVAGDLRFVTGMFRIVSDLTHIDSMTRDVAYLAQVLPAEVVAKLEGKLARASELVATMVEKSVDAFLASDVELAHEVFALDDEVDALYRQSEASIVELIRTCGANEAPVAHLPELLMVAKYYERMGDAAQRIASWAVFRVTGEHEVYSRYAAEASDAASLPGSETASDAASLPGSETAGE